MKAKAANIFIPLLRSLLDATKTLNSGYPYAPFIPHGMENYEQAPLKIFYCGRDTYYWLPRELLTPATISSYLSKNASVITPELMLSAKNNLSNFWPFVMQLHLYIRTGEMVDDLTHLTPEQMQIVREVGYANLHCIELKQTLMNEGIWEDIHTTDYNLLVQKSKSIDRLKYLLDAYEPDVLFIFSWENYMEYFNGLTYENVSSWYEENLRSVFSIHEYRTKIIWTSHPRRFSFLKKDSRQMVKYLGNSAMNLLQSID